MRLPRGDVAHIEGRKIGEYLLSATHLVGRHKLRFFESVGFSRDRPEELTAALRALAVNGTVTRVLQSPYGTRYIVDGVVVSPAGAIVSLRFGG
jgi:hypothetical protein